MSSLSASDARGDSGRRSPTSALFAKKIRLAVRAGDPLSEAGVVSHLGRRPDVQLLSVAELEQAHVLVFVTAVMNVSVMEELRRVGARAQAGTGSGPRIIMILDRWGDVDLPSAIELGVAAVLWRTEATAERFVQTVITVSRGGSELPTEVQARLVADVARLQQTVLTPRGLTATGLDAREIDVLRLIAAGLDTAEIAKKMLYSERTVKGILYAMMARLGLRNRSHAVAYAIRAGIL